MRQHAAVQPNAPESSSSHLPTVRRNGGWPCSGRVGNRPLRGWALVRWAGLVNEERTHEFNVYKTQADMTFVSKNHSYEITR